jgi:tRNA-dihydrouridine synthase
MEDVTDWVYRRLVSDHGEPDVLMTEFTSAAILCSDHPHRALERLVVYPGELARRPLVAQLWGADPAEMERAARFCADRGFAGIDINMGCPVKKISKKGACSALIKFPALAAELIAAAKAGAGALPVSVKTRLGWSVPETEAWCGHLLDQGLAALTVHGRTVKQKSEGVADWEEIAKVVKLRDQKAPQTLVVGNGDVTRASAEALVRRSQVDGLMVGRGVFADLGVFARDGYAPYDRWPNTKKLELLERHIRDHLGAWQGRKDYEKLKKFFKNYTVGFDGALELRARLMETHDHSASLAVVAGWRSRGDGGPATPGS